MASPKISIIRATKQGLTLIEVLISIGILSIVGGVALYFSLDDTRAYTFRDDRDKIVSVLERARAQSMHGVCRSDDCEEPAAHGVYRADTTLVLFEGESYVMRAEAFDEIIELHSGAAVLAGAEEIIFAPLSGRVTTTPPGEWSIDITDGIGRGSTITTNSEGRIFWTN